MSEQTETKIDENSTPEQVEAYEMKKAEEWAKANPSEIPAQFKGDPQKFLESYKSLRGELTRLQQAAKGKAPEPAKAAETAPAVTEPVSTLQIPENKQPDPAEWAALNKELVERGDLTPESRQNLRRKYNLPDEVIDGYVAGIKARYSETARAAAQVVGGEKALSEIVEWSAKNLSEPERAMVNAALNTPGWQTVLMGLKARMDASNPARNEPKELPKDSLGRSLPSQPKAFANQKELTAAIRDSRYGVDPDYTALVQERLRMNTR